MGRRSKAFENWLTRQLVQSLHRVARWAPDRAILPLGTALGTLCYAALPRYREVARSNLRLAFGESWSSAQIERAVRSCFQHHGRTLVEFLRMPYWGSAQIVQRVEERGLERLEAALSEGRGAIIASAHYGNWELAAARIAHAGFPVNVVTRDADDAGVNALLNGVRRAAGYAVIPRAEATRGVLSCLRRNEVVAILMDQNPLQGYVPVDFFGHPAPTATGPAILARRTGARLLPAFIRRYKDGTHMGEVMPPVEWEATEDPERDVRVITQRLTHAIEAWVREEPEQWLWFHNRWKQRDPEPLAVQASAAQPGPDSSP
jgi:Kdo2-lipid IVA lauroyltransferase/acyltransferase